MTSNEERRTLKLKTKEERSEVGVPWTYCVEGFAWKV